MHDPLDGRACSEGPGFYDATIRNHVVGCVIDVTLTDIGPAMVRKFYAGLTAADDPAVPSLLYPRHLASSIGTRVGV